MIGLEQWNSLLPDVKVKYLPYHKTTHKVTVDVYRAILPKFQIEKGKKVKQTYEAELTSILEDKSRKEEKEQLFARIKSEVVQTPQEFTVRTSSDEGVSTNEGTEKLTHRTTHCDKCNELEAKLIEAKKNFQGQIDELNAKLKVLQMAVLQQYPLVEEANHDSD